MDAAEVAAELGAALGTIEGLTVPEWGEKRVDPPFVLIPLPDRIDYDMTYQRGGDRVEDWPVMVLVPHPARPDSVRKLAPYVAGSGAQSVKQAIEDHTYTACDTVRVAWSEFDTVRYAEIDYLAAIFHLDIAGKGA